MATEEVQERLPVLYFGHGAPPLADDALWTGQFASWAAELPRPRAVLIVSAHWESAPVTIGATTTVPLVHDFWGFPERYYRVTYPAPGAPRLAESVRGLLGGSGVPVADEPARGLDHGAYVPLKEMYPDADVPVLQISMPTLDPRRLFDLGRRLAPLRDEGVLVMGSGFLTHNLSCVDMSLGADREPPSWSAEFDDWANRAAQAGDIDALLDWRG
ncbi:dioxygenase family protein, partial [Thermobifida halotolerans]|uniref:dioxygenase family protein n=1 Tax=Thermobifida halotolerans TaxID=483545 RepID=UPI001F1CA123